MPDYQRALQELNRIAAEELGPRQPRRHRHDWQTSTKLERGTTVTFTCSQCERTKKVKIPARPISFGAGRQATDLSRATDRERHHP